MSWLGWLGVAVGVVGYAVAWRIMFRAFALGYWSPDWGDVAVAVGIATLVAFAFPFVLAGVMVRRLFNDDSEAFARALGGEPAAVKRKRKEDELREREFRITRMEKELGL